MSDCPEAALPAAPCDPSADARVARLKTFERDRLIVDCLNRGVSVAGIAARVGAGDKRMRALVVTIARNTCRKTLKTLIQRPGSLVLIPGLTLRDAHKSISAGAFFSTKWGRWPGGPDGVRKAGLIRRRFAMTVAQSDLVRSGGPHPIRRFAPPSPAKLEKGGRAAIRGVSMQ